MAIALALDLSGHTEAAVTLVVTVLAGCALIIAAEHRQRRETQRPGAVDAQRAPGPIKTHRIQESVQLLHPPSQVWALIVPAEHTVRLSPNIRRAYRVPGTPDGLGEQQAMTDLDGNTAIVEVIEFEPDRRAVSRVVSPPLPVPVRYTYELQPLDGGCLFTYGQEYDAPPQHVLEVER